MTAVLLAFALTSCEAPQLIDQKPDTTDSGNAVLQFTATPSPVFQTRGGVYIGDYFTKLNVMLFNADGNKVFDKVKTQTTADDGFGTLSLEIAEGTYTVVAVGHSSVNSATIKSPQQVTFTASNGEKLTDTFCHCSTITVGGSPASYDLLMHRVAAMVRFVLTDTDIPTAFARLKIDYTGGSANFNPSSSEGITKSTQSETRTAVSPQVYSVFTFPYLSESGTLKMTLSALDAQGVVIHSRTFEPIPVTRNRITSYTGQFFDGTGGEITQTAFGFTIDTEWAGEDHYTF